MITLFQKRPIFVIIALIALMLLPQIDVPEVTIMEARNFITAREMSTDGNWMLTTMNGEPRYQKPPLPTWLTAVSGMTFGMDNVWALRLPAVLMIMLLASVLFLLSRKLLHNQIGAFHNSLIVCTSLYVILIIFEGPWDIYAHAFMLTGIYAFVHVLQSEKIKWGFLLLGSIGIAASIMSKGPVSLYALFLPFMLAYGFAFKDASFKRKWLQLLGMLVVGLLLGFAWYAYVRFKDPETFKAITSKETSNWSSYNVRPFYYYWSFFTQSGLWTIPALISLLYPYMKSRVSNLRVYKFTLLWTLFAVILLSVIPEKKSRYLMPVLIPLAMNIGMYVQYLVNQWNTIPNKKEKWPLYFHFGILALFFVAVPFVSVYYIAYENALLDIVGILMALCSFGLGAFLLLNLWKGRMNVVMNTFVLGLIAASWVGLKIIDSKPIDNTEYRTFAELETNDLPLYAYDFTSPELVWAKGDKIERLEQEDLSSLPIGKDILVMECESCDYNIHEEFEGFKLTLVDSIDINKAQRSARRAYRKRKAAKIYLVRRLVN